MKKLLFISLLMISQLSFGQYLLTNGSNSMTGSLNIERQGYSAIELKSNTGSFIDFHSSITSDYDGRIIWNLANSKRFDIYGPTNFKSDITWGPNGASLNSNQGASIELRGTGIPFIDFSNDASTDYDMRLILRNNDLLQIYGGSVCVGSILVPSGYKLGVDGKVIAEEVKVELSQDWPDYVFDEENYSPMSIEEKEAFTQEYKHLPSFAPEAEMKENGIILGDNITNTVKELEEAYLYIYQLNDLLKEQKAQIEAMNEKLNELSK